jgi:hypothetical protein
LPEKALSASDTVNFENPFGGSGFLDLSALAREVKMDMHMPGVQKPH